MGLLDVLGLKAPPGPATSAASHAEAAPPEAGGDLEDAVVIAHDDIAALFAKLADDKARDGLEAELAALRARHAGLAADKRAAAKKAELAAASALRGHVQKLADKADLARELADARMLVEAGLTAVNAMVLSVITIDALRTVVNTELTKLRTSQAKAAKIADPKAALAGFTALLASVRALQAKAQAARDTSDVDQREVAPLAAAAHAAVDALPAPLKPRLAAALAEVEADRARFVAAMDAGSLGSAVKPALAGLGDTARRLPAAGAKVDSALARAAKALATLDGEAADALKARLKALQDERAGDWPAGRTAAEMNASFERVVGGADAIATEAEGLGPKLQRQREIAVLRKRLDALKPRTDRAAGPPDAPFLAVHQKGVTVGLAMFERFEKLADLKSCEVLFSQIGAKLDMLDTLRTLLADARARLAQAKNGGIKAALGVALPAGLAPLRAKALDETEKDIASMIDNGNFVAADKAIVDWLASAKTWTEAPEAYANLRSNKPKKAVMTALIGKPGGGAVFDALVADLPDATTDTKTMTTAIEARFGTQVHQFNHREKGMDGAKDDAVYTDARKETNPDAPQKGLKDLYRVLRMVPQKDVSYTESIVDYEEVGHGAFQQRGGKVSKKDKGGQADRIVMYAGRPGDGETVGLGATAPAKDLDPNAQPVGDKTVNWYSFAALHEVAHGLDDARNVMGSHMKEAGWEECAVGDVAKKVAQAFGYDAGYVEALLTGDPGKPPVTKPARPAAVKSDDEWNAARGKVEAWARNAVESANPWDSISKSTSIAIGGRVYQEAYKKRWVAYDLSARARGIRGYQFRAPGEWFAELYAAFHMGKLKPTHPSAAWLQKLKTESQAESAG